MKHHELKIDKCYADAKFSGKKPWEFRVNDRDFKVGDLVSYNVNEDPEHPVNDMIFQISYVLQVDEKHCIFTEKVVQSKFCNYLDGKFLDEEEKCAIRRFRHIKAKKRDAVFLTLTGFESDLINSFRGMIMEGLK